MGNSVTVIGANANVTANNLDHATALGADSVVSSSNTIVLGRSADTVQIPGGLNVTGAATLSGSLSADTLNAATQFNLGGLRIISQQELLGNFFVGVNTGVNNTTGVDNNFFGGRAAHLWAPETDRAPDGAGEYFLIAKGYRHDAATRLEELAI